jgi:ATP-binding cassette subfamily G (WHITE) protein 2 (SNQ2)
MANEFVGRNLKCVAPDYIPYGPGYPSSASQHRGCSVAGSNGQGIIEGAAYIGEQYGYSFGHVWRNFGVLIGFWAFFIFLTSVGFELRNSQSGSSVLLFKRGSEKERGNDEENAGQVRQPADAMAISGSDVKHSTFTWKNLDYYIPVRGEKKKLLDKVFGFVKPGSLVALMGSSGAG